MKLDVESLPGVGSGDVVLRTEPLVWAGSPELVAGLGPDEPLPLISFGPGWASADRVDRTLERSGLAHRTVLECPGLSGVQAAVEAGLGVAALNGGNLNGDHDVLEALRHQLVAALDAPTGATGDGRRR